jgi:hypothetical protein
MARRRIKMRYEVRVTQRVRIQREVRLSARVVVTTRHLVEQARRRGDDLTAARTHDWLLEAALAQFAAADPDDIRDAIERECREVVEDDLER